ncbi:MAG: O-antigen ligase family protein [Chloroflexi bacterium]|nr:O-antigen ligase family protein [Chloroflexota bacterium]
MIRDNPIRGIGLDNFLYKYPRYMLPEAWREPNLSHPHNLVLDFWLRLGSPGLIVILWLLYGFFRAGARLHRRIGDRTCQALAIGLMASMVDFVVHGLIDNSYFVVDLAIIFWATLAMLRILDREGDSA